MAKIRSIKPNFFTSAQIADCSRDARLLFIGLWVFSDDAGIHPASFHTLRLEVFPGEHDVTNEKISALIDELIKNNLIIEYEVNEEPYWLITGWTKHQKIARPNYRYPKPLNSENNLTTTRIKKKTIPKLCRSKLKVMPEIGENSEETVKMTHQSSAETLPQQCSNNPGNGNGDGKEICRIDDANELDISEPDKQADTADIKLIFDYWRMTLDHPKAVLDKKSRQAIDNALKQYSLDDLQRAIRGCGQSKFHMGDNPQHKRYDDITLILRDATHIENFITQAQSQITDSQKKNDLFEGAI